MRGVTLIAALGAIVVALAAAGASAGVRAGPVVLEPPTTTALGFEWRIEGDEGRVARLTARYRPEGTSRWREAPPPLRLQRERVGAADGPVVRNMAPEVYTAPNMFAGSIVDLQPDTAYEIELNLVDPQGVGGVARRRFHARTRAEPRPAPGGRVYHVYPRGYTGQTQSPAFFGLKEAYFTASVGGDHYNIYPPRVRPGDVILVHAGLYKDQRFNYGHELVSGFKECCDTTGDGTYYLTGKGTAKRPIVIKAAGDGPVVFDGDGNAVLFNVMGAAHNFFDGITFQNTGVAIEAGLKDIAGMSGLTVLRCHFEDVGVGVHTDWGGSTGYFIADNTFVGREKPDVLVNFARPWPGQSREEWAAAAPAWSQYAVKIYGSGHVVAYNRVRNFHDGLDLATFGLPDPRHPPVAVDIYNNDISMVHDDCIEADGAAFNVRVMRNRCVNAGGSGISGQPLYGGPVYVIRNVVWNVPGSFGGIKFADAAGMLVYNNTFAVAVRAGDSANVHFRNNLILAQSPRDPAMAFASFTAYSSSDYNGFMAGTDATTRFAWRTPNAGAAYRSDRLQDRTFASLQTYADATGQDRHSRMVDYGVFESLRPVDPKAPVSRVYPPEAVRFGLRAGSAAIDAGTVIPGITDGFHGAAPDLGAVEFGDPEPHYGPR